MSDPRLYVGAALDAILKKAYAPKNLEKETWVTMEYRDIVRRIHEEIGELNEALARHDSDAILLEAADVMAFAAMLNTRAGWYKITQPVEP